MLGFGILFTGMSLMDTGVAPLRESAVFQNLFVTMTNPFWAFWWAWWSR